MELTKSKKTIEIPSDNRIATINAIKASIYDMLGLASISVDEINDRKIVITIITAQETDDVDEIICQFKDRLADHQVREMLEEKNKVIRNILYAQAFEPCDNLKEVIKKYV